jgi:ribosomal protein L12E/L44/L45/RPP1/RPP2
MTRMLPGFVAANPADRTATVVARLRDEPDDEDQDDEDEEEPDEEEEDDGNSDGYSE